MYSITFSSHETNLFSFQSTPLTNVKKIDCALLPPSRRSLHMHLLRAQYVTILWSRASSPCPADGLSPQENGWCKNNDILQPLWFQGPALPDTFLMTELEEDNDMIEERDAASEEESDVLATTPDMVEVELSDSGDEPWSEDSNSDLDDN